MTELLTVQDVAQFLGVPVSTVYRWNTAGGGPRRIRVGKHVRYRWSDVESWLTHNAVPERLPR